MRGIIISCLVVLALAGGLVAYEMNRDIEITNPPKSLNVEEAANEASVPGRLPLLGEAKEAGGIELPTPDLPVSAVENLSSENLTTATPYSALYVQDMLGREADAVVAAQPPAGTHEPLAMWRDRNGHTFMLYLNEAKASQASTLLRSYGIDDEAVDNVANLVVWSHLPLEANFMSSLEAKLASR